MQAYSQPERATDPMSLPDLEIFHSGGETNRPEGWYWWSCFPGCMPDGEEPNGPFDTEAEALAAAQAID